MPAVMNLHPKSTIVLEIVNFVDKNGLLRRVWRRTDNTMAKKKVQKDSIKQTIYKNYT
jgi:hypothetical protein